MAPSPSSSAVARLGVDQLGVDEAARAEVHPVLLLALAPERHADVADAHRLGDPRAPALLEHRAEGGLAAAGLARHEHALDARRPRGRSRAPPPTRRGRRRRRASARRPRDAGGSIAGISRSVLPVPTGMWQRPMRSNAASAAPATNGPGVVGRDDALAGRDARTPRSCAPTRSPSCRGRPRSAGCSSACRWCRWSSRSGRSRTAPRRDARRSGCPRVHVSLSSRFSVSGRLRDVLEPARRRRSSRARRPTSFSR